MRIEDFQMFIRTVEFIQEQSGFYAGHAKNSLGVIFRIAIFEENIACFKNDRLIFQVPFSIDLGTFLVLVQEFQIIHERFIYEKVEVIEDEFLEGFDGDTDDLRNNIIELKNSKFMQLLNKEKKKQN